MEVKGTRVKTKDQTIEDVIAEEEQRLQGLMQHRPKLEAEIADLTRQRQTLVIDAATGKQSAIEQVANIESRVGSLTAQLQINTYATEQLVELIQGHRRLHAEHAITQMEAMFESYTEQLRRRTDEAHNQASPPPDLLDEIYALARQRYSLAHDLVSVLPSQRTLPYRLKWDINAILGGELVRRTPALAHPFAPRPVIEQPWKPLLAIIQNTEGNAQ